ncbi:D-Ala-D-Ala carboxypeptidase family metallohydrolase [Acetobacterium woodii]|uniref:Muramoyl-pentapeptide carboxypeptidase n=1 Tax=Acetobacterium woodii (strain ATCC 29683 / DSM 1030 / JCM 2381 / KCTC 1655 / WB1) TaxID=931626 RepID=H6LFF0_ACEWD|nr:peptidoglycan-binding protein [Acetobacterium woodii]AFA49437.1 muramoyl-pentapeptide carboxypeptidase [Acetobacterium woodii DSM 1030]
MYLKLIQEALIRAGYFPGPVDGQDGPLTRAAIKAFQSDHGLTADGLVGALTHHALFDGSTMTDADKPASTIDNQQLTPHFNREEFKCCCEGRYCNGFPAEMNPELVGRMEAIRLVVELPIIVTSGVRCPTRNAEVGGIPNSRHLSGNAADCYVPGMTVYELAAAARNAGLGVIVYENEGFCHLEL